MYWHMTHITVWVALKTVTENHDIFSTTAEVVKTLQSYFLVFSGHVYFAAGIISDLQNTSVFLLIAFQLVMTCMHILCFFFVTETKLVRA